ncbi:MAG TPA: type II toxin-antitoxin system RelE/ParE family toxin [Pseudomonas sp.]|nr:type II toxin-antitoxin system RelE/ParE family toxin [Pseudomonas sp.]
MARLQINWTDSALASLDSLFAYIAKDSPFYAQSFIQQLIRSVDRLSNFPKSGRRVAEANGENVREIIFQGYRIIYRLIDAQRIDILSVVHGRRDLRRIKNQPWKAD